MKLRPDLEAAAWLEQFDPTLDGFDWDDGNSGKNKRTHG